MAIEYFCISDSDTDMLEQIVQLERQVNGSKNANLGYFEAQSLIRYGRVYAALEYDEVLGAAYFLRDFDNPGRAFLYSTPEYAILKLPFQILQAALGAVCGVALCFPCRLAALFDRWSQSRSL